MTPATAKKMPDKPEERKYKAKRGSRMSDEDAVLIGETIMAFHEREGGWPTPTDLVNVARSKRSKIHKMFTWDNEEAAELYRRHQAGHYMRCVIIEREDNGVEDVRAFYAISQEAEDDEPITNERVFVDVNVVTVTDDYRHEVASDAVRELRAYIKKYRVILDLFKLTTGLEALLARLEKNL